MMGPNANPQQLEALIVEQMHDAVIFVDPDGVVRLWNRAAETLFGFSAAETVGGSLDLIIPERFRAAHAHGFRQAVMSGQLKSAGRVLTTRANEKSGRRLYVDFSFGLVKGPEGELLGVFAVGRDATARHLAESSSVKRG